MKQLLALSLALAITVPAAAQRRVAPIYPDVVQTSHASPATARLLRDFFDAKSRHRVDATMAFFAPDMLTYTDSTWGWPLDGHAALKGVFANYMPKWPAAGLSYPVRILGGPNSALVEFIDTKELFGAELRVFGVVDFKGGKVVRWVDYWDSNTVPTALDSQLRTPSDKFPMDYKDNAVGDHASARIANVARRLQDALAHSDSAAAASLFSNEAMLEDRTLRTQITGRAAIQAYLGRIGAQASYGSGATIRHIVGGDLGGGYEWRSSIAAVEHGVMALELDPVGQITRASVMYDGRKLAAAQRNSLAALALEP